MGRTCRRMAAALGQRLSAKRFDKCAHIQGGFGVPGYCYAHRSVPERRERAGWTASSEGGRFFFAGSLGTGWQRKLYVFRLGERLEICRLEIDGLYIDYSVR